MCLNNHYLIKIPDYKKLINQNSILIIELHGKLAKKLNIYIHQKVFIKVINNNKYKQHHSKSKI